MRIPILSKNGNKRETKKHRGRVLHRALKKAAHKLFSEQLLLDRHDLDLINMTFLF